MPHISVFIDKAIYDELEELVKNGVFPNVQTAVVIALKLLVNSIKQCIERGIELDNCADAILNIALKEAELV